MNKKILALIPILLTATTVMASFPYSITSVSDLPRVIYSDYHGTSQTVIDKLTYACTNVQGLPSGFTPRIFAAKPIPYYSWGMRYSFQCSKVEYVEYQCGNYPATMPGGCIGTIIIPKQTVLWQVNWIQWFSGGRVIDYKAPYWNANGLIFPLQ